MATDRNGLEVSLGRIMRWPDSVAERADRAFRDAAQDATSNLIVGGPYSPGTPVRSGRARDSWTAWTGEGEPRPFDREKEPRDNLGFVALGEAHQVIEEAPGGAPITLGSNAPYMRRLEDGYSRTQAPTGMVKHVIRNWQNIWRDAWARAGRKTRKVAE